MAVMTPPKKKKKTFVAKSGSFLRKIFGAPNPGVPSIASAKSAILKNKNRTKKLLREIDN